MTEIVIQLPGPPCGKGRPRFSRKTGHAYTPEKTRSYESMLQGAAITAMNGTPMFEGPVAITVTAYFPVPASWPKRKRWEALSGKSRPAKRPDADNLLKAVDSLNSVVFRDDAQIVDARITKHYSDQPRLEVRVRAA